MLNLLKRKCYEIEDKLFEFKIGLDFSGVITKDKFTVENDFSKENSTAYQAVYSRNIKKLIYRAFKTRIQFDSFIDIGSGKGKACFFAATTKKFKSIIGIEFSKDLNEISLKYNEKKKIKNLYFLNKDALDYILPESNNIIFMFNPFNTIIMKKFIENNLDHFKKYESLIAYANDVEIDILNHLGFSIIYRDATRKISLLRYIKRL
jgi:SAM-dependent methyltransferase